MRPTLIFNSRLPKKPCGLKCATTEPASTLRKWNPEPPSGMDTTVLLESANGLSFWLGKRSSHHEGKALRSS